MQINRREANKVIVAGLALPFISSGSHESNKSAKNKTVSWDREIKYVHTEVEGITDDFILKANNGERHLIVTSHLSNDHTMLPIIKYKANNEIDKHVLDCVINIESQVKIYSYLYKTQYGYAIIASDRPCVLDRFDFNKGEWNSSYRFNLTSMYYDGFDKMLCKMSILND